MTDKEIETYTEKYTFRDSVIVDDKFNQLTLNIRGKLNKSLQKRMFNNTQEQWDNLLLDCRQDENFNEGFTTRFAAYLHAIYLYDATADRNKNDISDPFYILDVNNYQALDNNAICYKHIDYILNKDASNFGDIFTFAEANKNIASNIKANSCYFNLIKKLHSAMSS